MTRIIGIIVVSLLSFISQLAVAATTIKIATIAPDSTTWMKEMRAGAAEIAERTQGRVKVKFYPGGVMGNDQAVLRKMRIGQLHGGAVTTGAFNGIFPNAQIYSLPFVFNSIEEVNHVRQKMDEEITQGLAAKGYVSIGISNGGFAYFAGNAPVTSADSIKNKRVWVPQGDMISEAMLRNAGLAPVSLPISDVYTALQTGLLDIVAGNPSSIIAFQWHTKVKYMTDEPILFLMGMMVVDKRTYNKLSADDQLILKEVMTTKFARLDELNQKDNSAAKAALLANGVKFVKPSEQERQKWRAIVAKALVELEEKGAYTKDFLDMMQKHVEAYRSQAAQL